MTEQRTLVAVVDDDESVRESLPDLLAEMGFTARAFASAEEFLASDHASDAGCMILDICLPGMSGPDLQRELVRRGHSLPTIFITAQSRQGNPTGLRLGAFECLFKPFSEQELRTALENALAKN